MSEIPVACEGSCRVELDELIDLQGDLKALSDENFRRLRRQIVEHGFSAPFTIWWGDEDRAYILDGHQRRRTLLRMRDEEGWDVPPLPCCEVAAEDEQEAKLKLLGFASQYGEVQQGGLREFLFDLGIEDVNEVLANWRLPEINLGELEAGFFLGELGSIEGVRGDSGEEQGDGLVPLSFAVEPELRDRFYALHEVREADKAVDTLSWLISLGEGK